MDIDPHASRLSIPRPISQTFFRQSLNDYSPRSCIFRRSYRDTNAPAKHDLLTSRKVEFLSVGSRLSSGHDLTLNSCLIRTLLPTWKASLLPRLYRRSSCTPSEVDCQSKAGARRALFSTEKADNTPAPNSPAHEARNRHQKDHESTRLHS